MIPTNVLDPTPTRMPAPRLSESFSAPPPADAQLAPPYDEPSTWRGPVFFHWVSMNDDGTQRGQWYSPWLPHEGRAAWDGSVEHFAEHTLFVSYTGSNMLLFQYARWYEREMWNHVEAIRRLHDPGYRQATMDAVTEREGVDVFQGLTASDLPVPKVMPFLALESFPEYFREKDFHTDEDRELFFAEVVTVLDRLLGELGRDALAWMDGKLLMGLWYVPGCRDAPADLLPWLNDRIEQRYGFRAHFTAHDGWKNAGPDELNWLFNGMDPFRVNEQGNVDVHAGFYPTHKTTAFLARDHGAALTTGLGYVDSRIDQDEPPRVLLVESYNEYSEGSGVYPARCAVLPDDAVTANSPSECTDTPCVASNEVAFEDAWGDCDDPRAPYLYLDLLRDHLTALQ